MRDSFATYHPMVNFIYFCVVLLVPVFFLHPVLLGISLIAGIFYTVCQQGIKKIRSMLPWVIAAFLLPAIINPLFNHQGMTLLLYLRNGNPITLESILYGFEAGTMMALMIIWFGCFNQVMTSDKLMQLTGRILPAASLLFTMTLRFVPGFTTQIKKVSEAQKCIGCDVGDKSLPVRLKHAFRILSIMVTWAFEHSIETADSMKSRGYGLRGRRQFIRYRFDRRDGVLLAVITGAAFLFFGNLGTKQLLILYFPVFTMNKLTLSAMTAYISYAFLSFLPVILCIMEEIKWKYTISRI